MANETCPQMPPLVMMTNGWAEYLDILYVEYLSEFINNSTYHRELKVKTFTQLEYNMKQATFNHLTTKGSKNRLYNEKRCQKYKWIKPMIEGNCGACMSFRYFPDLDWNKKWKRFIIWCDKYDFVIILEKRDNCYMLITAYCVIYDDKRIQLERKYQKYIKTKSA